LARWQEEWTSADFDTCIPVVTHPKTGRKLVGLPSERVLAEFFLQSRSRLLDNAVCYYWPKPVVLVCGSLAVLWPLLSELRLSAEITHASVASEGESQLRKPTRPDLVVIHSEGMAPKSRETISAACSVIGIPWLLATEDPSEEAEIQALSAGAMEYLPIRGDGRVARARLRRVVASRLAYARRDEQAQKDPLTGLANRRRLISHLSAEWHRAEGFGRPLSLLLLDIDHFKAFNAEYGYLEGDRCLTRLARLFELSVHRANEFLARLESDTFIVVLPESIPEDALQLAELLRQAVTEQEIEHRTSPTQPHLTVSAGVATLIPSQTSTLDALVDAADQACQSAKAAGRNRVHVC
jgi:diguanylate cyclase (GGDEF)-like protein